MNTIRTVFSKEVTDNFRDHHELRGERRIVATDRFTDQQRHDRYGTRVVTEQAQRGRQFLLAESNLFGFAGQRIRQGNR